MSVKIPRKQWTDLVERIKKLEDRVARLVQKDPSK